MLQIIPPTLSLAFLAVAFSISSHLFNKTGATSPSAEAPVGTVFIESFNKSGTLSEAGTIAESASAYWWLDSAAKLTFANGVGATIQGDLPADDPWHVAYKKNNPLDTENGAHPQNLFRLISRSSWNNVRITGEFAIRNNNQSMSPNRDPSNGILLMSRYSTDGQTLYYAGIRVDGDAVIKKKYHGTYYMMAEKELFSGLYDRDTNPSILPHGVWLSLQSETITNKDGSVTVSLFMREKGTWKKILEAHDTGQYDNTPPLTDIAHIGIRTDFMDVQFRNFRIEEI